MFLVLAAFASIFGSARGGTSEEARRFTVADDISLNEFGDPYTGRVQAVTFSPDKRYVVVDTQRGRLDINRAESTLRFYRVSDVVDSIRSPLVGTPAPMWVLSSATSRNGPIITDLRWSRDSTGLAYVERTPSGRGRLVLATLDTRATEALTPEDQDVTAFDIVDRTHFIYAALSSAIRDRARADMESERIIGTGRDLFSLLFPDDLRSEMEEWDRSELWAVVDGKHIQVLDRSSGRAITLYRTGWQALAMAPNGRWAITVVPVSPVPDDWEQMYPPNAEAFRSKLLRGVREQGALEGSSYLSEYVLIELSSGTVTPATAAPSGFGIGWHGHPLAVWSPDSRKAVMSNTFVDAHRSGEDRTPRRPCVAVIDLPENRSNCLGTPHAPALPTEILDATFTASRDTKVVLHYRELVGGKATPSSSTYIETPTGHWTLIRARRDRIAKLGPITINVEQSLNDAPQLVATESATQAKHVIWEPNPQLKSVSLGEAAVFSWTDLAGQPFTGGLFKPPDYEQGRRYPLIIQTHGFLEHDFRPSGMFPTAFAARELAASGFVVLQIDDIRSCTAYIQTPQESTCAVSGYESAVDRLVALGLVDRDRIGIVGFSRTSYYVLYALTHSTIQFRAASITDGVNAGYFQYLAQIDSLANIASRDAEKLNGGVPFAEGLREWLARSPEFNMEKVTTPLLISATSRPAVLVVWEPYAELRRLNKPTELVLLSQGTHVLTNPAGRMLSQGGTIDWFRFWLQDYEDPDSAKSAQYERWHELRKLQSARNSIADDANTDSPTL